MASYDLATGYPIGDHAEYAGNPSHGVSIDHGVIAIEGYSQATAQEAVDYCYNTYGEDAANALASELGLDWIPPSSAGGDHGVCIPCGEVCGEAGIPSW